MLASASISRNSAEISRNKSDEKALAELLGSDWEEEKEEDEIIEINLWEWNQDVFSIYRILYPYISGEDYHLDTFLLVELIKDYKLELKKALIDISYIHSGFISVVRDSNERYNTNDAV